MTGEEGRSPPAIAVRDLSVTLGGNRILKNVSLEFEAGVTSGLIGPNGAGKSTLLNAVCRLIPIVSGGLLILGQDVGKAAPEEIIHLGLARTFQGAQFVSDLTAVENVMLGRHSRIRQGFVSAALSLPNTRRSESEAREAALAVMRKVGIGHLADRRITELSFGNQKKVDLARSLAAGAPCVLLDEPMAGLSSEEKDSLCQVLLDLRDADGPTIILIEHDMQVVSKLCAWTAVLDAGELIASGATKDVLASPRVVRAYMGSA